MRIDLVGLTRRYGSRVALAPLDLGVPAGSALGLLGPNGAGKSTLLGLCAGLLLPTAGSVSLDGRSARDPAARAGLGVLPERPALPPAARLRDLLAIRHRADPEALLDELGLVDCADVPLGTLSSGQRHRSALALALHGSPRLLLLDEPLTALDPESVDRVVAAVGARHRAGCTLLLATHRPEAWLGVLTELARLDAGRFTSLGSTVEALGQVPRSALGVVHGALAPVDPGPVVAVRSGWSAGSTSVVRPAPVRVRSSFELAVRELTALGLPAAVGGALALLAAGLPLVRATAMGAPSRATLDLTLWWTWLVACGLAMGVGSRVVSGALVDRTAVWRLTGPIAPGRWALERVAAASVVALCAHGSLFGGGLVLLGRVPDGAFAFLLVGQAEVLLLVALAALFGSVYRPIGALASVGGLWLVGHLAGAWSEALAADGLGGLAGGVVAFLPDLDLLDVHGAVVDGRPVGPGRVARALVWAAAWTLAALAGTVMVVERRDLA